MQLENVQNRSKNDKNRPKTIENQIKGPEIIQQLRSEGEILLFLRPTVPMTS